MSSRRTLILVGAIVVGAIAALLILRYVNGVEDKASNDTQMVPVVIATGDIAGQTATINMSAGEVITIPKFSNGSDLSSSKSNAISPGYVAVTASFDATRGVAGLVQPGDYVNILVDTTAGSGDGSGGAVSSSYLFQKVKVLALGTDLGTQVAASGDATTPTTPPAASDLVTFEVPPEAANVIAAATQKSLRLVLVRPDYQPHPIPAITVDPSAGLPGEQGRTPYDGQPSTAAPAVGATK